MAQCATWRTVITWKRPDHHAAIERCPARIGNLMVQRAAIGGGNVKKMFVAVRESLQGMSDREILKNLGYTLKRVSVGVNV